MGPPAVLRGRRRECEALDRVLDQVRAGHSGSLVIRGEQGVGKSVLLEHLVSRATDCRVVRASGVEAEMELAYAGLHQLCGPLLGGLDLLPTPQRGALATAFGLTDGPPPDRFLVGLAVLNLLSDASDARPLVGVIDDVQWFDRASAHALAFVGRRLQAEAVAIVFATRDVDEGNGLDGLPVLTVTGLRGSDARALLGRVFQGPLDERIVARIVAETRGNPLALLELPRGLTTAELAGGFGLPTERPLTGRIEASFRRRVETLPADTRRALLIAAAEPLGDPTLMWSAAHQLGMGPDAIAPAEAAGLVTVGRTVTFHHTLVRSAIYRAASPADRRATHGALADATDAEVDPDRRAWHRAHASSGPDEGVAAELEHSAGRAQARGGLAAAAAFRERAMALTADAPRRSRRALAAAEMLHLSGAPAAALRVLAEAEPTALDALDRARAELLRAQIASALSRGMEAPPLLLRAAAPSSRSTSGWRVTTYLEAMVAGMFVGGEQLVEIAGAVREARPAVHHPPRPADLLLDGMAARVIEGFPAAVPLLKEALVAFRTERIIDETGLRWIWASYRNAVDLWDDAAWDELSSALRGGRSSHRRAGGPADGAERPAGHPRAGRRLRHRHRDERGGAEHRRRDRQSVRAVQHPVAHPLAGSRGRVHAARRQPDRRLRRARRRSVALRHPLGPGAAPQRARSVGRGIDVGARTAASSPSARSSRRGACLELVEAAASLGDMARARDALDRLAAYTTAAGTDWSLGVEARSRALVADDGAAEEWYRASIERLARTHVRLEEARSVLLYGEWLQRQHRREEAREQLRRAHDMFRVMRTDAFADRAGRGLSIVGERVTRPAGAALPELTAQESQIARLARDGQSNPSIGAQLFISPRTVGVAPPQRLRQARHRIPPRAGERAGWGLSLDAPVARTSVRATGPGGIASGSTIARRHDPRNARSCNPLPSTADADTARDGR